MSVDANADRQDVEPHHNWQVVMSKSEDWSR